MIRSTASTLVLVPLLAVSVLTVSCSHTGSGGGSNPNRSIFGGRSSKSGYQLPAYEEKTLENGLRILFVPDESLPYVTFAMLVRSGSSQDPQGQSGLATMVAELLDKGSGKRTAPQIALELGQIGAEYDASASSDFTMASASGLSTQAVPLLNTFHEIVTQPTFSDIEIERMRKQITALIQKRVDSPDQLAEAAYIDALFGPHPYGRPPSGSVKSIQGLKKKNIIQHYLRYFRPNNSMLAVVGKYTPEFAKQIETKFGSWAKRDVSPVVFPEIAPPQGIQIRLVDKPGLVQSQVRIGHLGIKRNNEDFVGVRLANTILGGAFASRLNSRIRKDLGLTYGVSSSFDARLDRGPFTITTFTKNESVGQLIGETLKLLTGFKDEGVTKAEVEAAKGYLKGIFPAAIETPEKLASNLLLLRFYGISDAYLSDYLTNVGRLSTSDVNRVIKKYFDDKNLKIVVYSSAPAVEAQLKNLGPVEIKKASEF